MKKIKLILSSIVLGVFIVTALACQSSSNTTAPKKGNNGSGKDEARIGAPGSFPGGAQELPCNAIA